MTRERQNIDFDGQVVATLPVGERATMPHHTEYEYPPDDILFASGCVGGRKSGRLVATGADESWVLLVHFDNETGQLSIDEAFRDEGAAHPGVNFDRMRWPHGDTGAAKVHGSLFGK